MNSMIEVTNITTLFRKIKNGFWEKDESKVIDDILADKLLEKFISEFEDYKLDFKQELPAKLDRVGELISAISNEGGGVIFFGITNDREIIGIENTELVSEKIFRIIRDSCNPIPELQTIKIITSKFNEILVVLIPPPRESLVSYKEVYYERIGDSKEKMSKSKVIKRQMELLSILKHYELIWENSVNLLPVDILGPGRGLPKYGFKDYYLNRKFDGDFSKNLADLRNNIIVIGGPLSGKSRLVYENLKNSETTFDIIIPKYCNFALEDIFIPNYKKVDGNRVLILDDLDRYFTFEYFEYLFQKFLKNPDIRIIATCQSGRKYIDIKNKILKKLNIDLDTIFTTVRIDPLGEKEAKNIAKDLKKDWNLIDFDGNIGTILVPFAEMKRRYIEECSDKAKFVLRAVKIAYLAGIISEKSNYNLEWISSICEIFFDLSLKKYELITLIEELGPNDLEFIQIYNQIEFFLEEAYLEKIIDTDKELLTIEEYMDLIDYFNSDAEVLVLLGDHLLNFGIKWSQKSGYKVHEDVFKMSIHCYERLLELSPGSFYAYGVLGNAYGYLEDYDKSIFYFETAVDYNSEIFQFWGNLGIIYRNVKNYEQTIFCFKKVLELNPGDYIAFYQLAITYMELENNKMTLFFFKKSLESNSEYFNSNVMKGLFLKRNKRFKEAISLLEHAKRIDPDEWMPYYSLAEIYSVRHRNSEAIENLEIAVKLNPLCKDEAKENSFFENIKDSIEFRKLMKS